MRRPLFDLHSPRDGTNAMTERTLFPDDPPGNLPHNRTATSRHAATLAKPFACRQLSRVLTFFVERGDDGATDEECSSPPASAATRNVPAVSGSPSTAS